MLSLLNSHLHIPSAELFVSTSQYVVYGKRISHLEKHKKQQTATQKQMSIWRVGGALWARIVQNVKKHPLTVNVEDVEDFKFFGFYSYGSLGVPLVPKSHDILVELFRFTRYVERNKVCFAPFLRFH